MTMIVIFVPSPPQPPPLLESATSPPPSTVFSSPTRAPCVRRLHTTSVRGPCGREKRDLSFSLFPSRGDGETRGDREDSEIPSRPVYSLLSLGPAHRRARARERVSTYSYVPLSVSLSLIPPLTRSFLPRPSNDSPLSIQRFRAGLYLRHSASFSACRGRLIVARLCRPTADRVPV